jgi:hypothetical protein
MQVEKSKRSNAQWDEFRRFDVNRVGRLMRKPGFIFDGRSVFPISMATKPWIEVCRIEGEADESRGPRAEEKRRLRLNGHRGQRNLKSEISDSRLSAERERNTRLGRNVRINGRGSHEC